MITRKHLLPIAATLLLASSSIQGQTPQNIPAQPDTIVAADTLKVASNDTTIVVDADMNVRAENPEDFFVGDDNRLKFRFNNGEVADIGDLLSDSWDIAEKPAWLIVAVLTIIFCVPCLAMVIVLMLLFSFLRRRNRDRNEIISKAIDNNYTLPDAFYGRQPTTYTQPTPQQDGSAGNGTQTPPAQPVQIRNPRTFNNALTLIVTGFCVFLFFAIVANVGVGFLFGGIPFFLGVGRMLAYYYIPGFDTTRNRRYNYQQRPQYPPYNPPYNNGYNQQQPPYYNNSSSNIPAGNDQGNNTPGNCSPPPPGYNR